MFLGYLPTFAILSGLFPELLNGPLIFVAFAAYALTWLYFANVSRRWLCPRCGEYFFGTPWLPQLPMMFVRRCRSCDLPKYAPSDPDPPTMTFYGRS